VASGSYTMSNARRANYLLCSAFYEDYYCPAWTAPTVNLQGMFYDDIGLQIAQIKDGMSMTAMAGESPQLHFSTSYGPYWGAGAHTSTHGRVLRTSDGGYTNYLPNAPYQTTSNPQRLVYAWVMGSKHTGGLNMLFGDGSVKFVKNSIHPHTWWAINTIAGGEVVGADAF